MVLMWSAGKLAIRAHLIASRKRCARIYVIRWQTSCTGGLSGLTERDLEGRNLRLDEDHGCVADAAAYDAHVRISTKAAKLECIRQTEGRWDSE